MVTPAWKDYQEEAATFFRSLGLDAETDVRVKGVRTSHDVDVVVRSRHVGFEVLWLVECKSWQSRVSKLHVLALREIVADIGADRGILLAEVGFQSGALEAAALTNVRPTSLMTLKDAASVEILAMRLRELYDRAETSKERYWNMAKEERIRCGLRPEVGAVGYSATHIVEFAEEALAKAFRGAYPFDCKSLVAYAMWDGPRTFASAAEVLKVLEPMLSDLEQRLLQAEAGVVVESPARRPTRG